MAGKKGRSGGARTPRDPAKAKKSGPPIRRVVLDKDTAHEIKVLLLAAGQPYTAENVAAQIAAWSRQAWTCFRLAAPCNVLSAARSSSGANPPRLPRLAR